jgi:hypothetical protein
MRLRISSNARCPRSGFVLAARACNRPIENLHPLPSGSISAMLQSLGKASTAPGLVQAADRHASGHLAHRRPSGGVPCRRLPDIGAPGRPDIQTGASSAADGSATGAAAFGTRRPAGSLTATWDEFTESVRSELEDKK